MRGARQGQGGGVELDKLEVGNLGSGPESQGDPIAGRDRWIGGVREQLAGAAGREDNSAAPEVDLLAVRVSSARMPTTRPPSWSKSRTNSSSRTVTRGVARIRSTTVISIREPVASPPA